MDGLPGTRVRALVALALLLASLGGTGELHPDDETHHHDLDALHAGAEDHLHVATSHPGEPLHVEGSATRVHSPCRFCLFRLQSSGEVELSPHRPAAPGPSGAARLDRCAPPSRSHLRLRVARAPPRPRSIPSVIA